jgi:hypothetical protein
MRTLGYFSLSQSAGNAGSSFAATCGLGELAVGVLIEVVKAPDQEHRYLVCPGNTYSGRTSCKFVNLAHASTKIRSLWSGGTSMAIAERIFEDFLTAANAGAEADWMKSIRVTSYHSDPGRREVYLPREVEQAQVEPEVFPVAQGTDGEWRVVPTTGFKRGPRGWSYNAAFVDQYTIGRTIELSGTTKLECIQRLFGAIMPAFVPEFVRTLPLADPNAIPKPAPPPEEDYEPTEAELAAIPALSVEYVDSLSAAEEKRLFIYDWKFRAGYRKRKALDKIADAKRAEILARQAEEEKLKQIRKGGLAVGITPLPGRRE